MTGYVRQSVADILPGEEVRSEPLNAEFNRIQVAFDGSVGHTHDGTAGSGPPINLTTSIVGTLPVANGGTGGTTLDALKTSLSLGTAAYTSLTDYATAAQGTKADGALQRSGGTMTGAINMGGFGLSNVGTIALNNQKITGMAAPTADTDAATRKFVLDTLASVDTSAFGAHVNNKSNPHEVTKAQVGLGNADNTSDANKPVSTATQSALDLKANLVSPTFTGTPNAPTPSVSTNTTQVATTAFVQSAISNNVPVATTSDINNSTGSGFTNAQTLGPILDSIRPFVGDLIESYRAVSANWLECNGSVVNQSTYPDLYALFGQNYADFIPLANSNFAAPAASNQFYPFYVDNFVFMQYPLAPGATGQRLYYSTNDGLNFTAPGSMSNNQIRGAFDIIKFAGYYVYLPSDGSNSGAGAYSTDGTTWSVLPESAYGSNSGYVCWATDGTTLFSTLGDSLGLFKKTNPNVAAVSSGNNLLSPAANVPSAIAYGNSSVVIACTDGSVQRSLNGTGAFSRVIPAGTFQNGSQCIRFINGSFYVLGTNSQSARQLWTSTDGVDWKVLISDFSFRTDMSIPDNIVSDGTRPILVGRIGTTSRFAVVLQDGSLYPLALNAARFDTIIGHRTPFRASDGLFVMKSASPSTTLLRGKLAPDKATTFQLPNYPSTKPSSKTLIRVKK